MLVVRLDHCLFVLLHRMFRLVMFRLPIRLHIIFMRAIFPIPRLIFQRICITDLLRIVFAITCIMIIIFMVIIIIRFTLLRLTIITMFIVSLFRRSLPTSLANINLILPILLIYVFFLCSPFLL